MSFSHKNYLQTESEYKGYYELDEDHRLNYKSSIIRRSLTPDLTEKKMEKMEKLDKITMKEAVVNTFKSMCGCFR